MTGKATNKKSTKVTKKDIFETAMAIRMVFGEQPDQFELEQTKTSVRMIVFSQESAEEGLPHVQQTLNDSECKAPVEILVRVKTLTAQPVEPKAVAAEETTTQESPAAPVQEVPVAPAQKVQDKISPGLRAYLNDAVIPGNKGIDVSVHLEQSMTAAELSKKLVALFGKDGARVNDKRTVFESSTWVVRVKRMLIERFNKVDFVTKVNRFYGEARAYSAL